MACASLVFNFLINYGSVVIFPLFIAVGFTLCLPGNLLIGTVSTNYNLKPILRCMVWVDFMISAFLVRPAASGCRLCHFDRALFRVSKSRVKNWEVLARRKYFDNSPFSVRIIIGIFSPCQDFSIF